jgi:hypothetical protein
MTTRRTNSVGGLIQRELSAEKEKGKESRNWIGSAISNNRAGEA